MSEMRSRSIGVFLSDLASASPTPGGGSVAALSGAIAADLGRMVCNLALKKSAKEELAALNDSFTVLEAELLDLATADEQAFDSVMTAYGMHRADDGRAEAIARALQRATDVPLATAERAIALLDALCRLAPLGTRHSISDVGVAAYMADAAMRSALLNVEVNLAYRQDQRETDRLAVVAADMRERASALVEQTISQVQTRLSK
jgi:methenyltetrahydrofolate cyclohydrolase